MLSVQPGKAGAAGSEPDDAALMRPVAADPQRRRRLVPEVELAGRVLGPEADHQGAAEGPPADDPDRVVQADALGLQETQQLRIRVADPGDPAGVAFVQILQPVGPRYRD